MNIMVKITANFLMTGEFGRHGDEHDQWFEY